MSKLPPDTIIAPAKLRDYLLVWRGKDDKSKWLATAGYTVNNWIQLQQDLRAQILPLEAAFVEETRFGQMFEIKGALTGPNGKQLFLRSFWLLESDTEQTKFITLYPDRE
ncbi:MAG: hypothetical protein H6658_21035 [Ardenticatenaceae bacterium]|nr:hypothetical protein [Ardenticatenaceae bacterium]